MKRELPPPPPVDPLLAKVRALDPARVRKVAAIIVAAFLAVILLVPREAPPPPSPARPDVAFIDKVGLVSAAYARETNAWLGRNPFAQIVVYVDRAPPDGDLRRWTVQAASDWRIGTDRRDRGLVLFVFRDARIVRAEVGYGLEGELPDAGVKQLLEAKLVPAFADGRYEEGLDAFLRTLYERMGGDAGAGRLALERAGRATPGWVDLWNLAVANGSRLLVGTWHAHAQGNAWERFVILLFAGVPLLFFLTGLAVLAVTVRHLWVLPRKLRARRAQPADPSALRENDPHWKEILMGPPVFLLCAGVVVLVLATADDLMTRKGRFGGGGVAVTWSPTAQVPVAR